MVIFINNLLNSGWIQLNYVNLDFDVNHISNLASVFEYNHICIIHRNFLYRFSSQKTDIILRDIILLKKLDILSGPISYLKDKLCKNITNSIKIYLYEKWSENWSNFGPNQESPLKWP